MFVHVHVHVHVHVSIIVFGRVVGSLARLCLRSREQSLESEVWLLEPSFQRTGVQCTCPVYMSSVQCPDDQGEDR